MVEGVVVPTPTLPFDVTSVLPAMARDEENRLVDEAVVLNKLVLVAEVLNSEVVVAKSETREDA